MKWIFGFRNVNKENELCPVCGLPLNSCTCGDEPDNPPNPPQPPPDEYEYEISGAPIEDVNGRYRLYSNYGGINSNLPIYINENQKYVMGPAPAESDNFKIVPMYDGLDFWASAVYTIYFDEGYFTDVIEEMDYSSFSSKFASGYPPAPDLKIIKL